MTYAELVRRVRTLAVLATRDRNVGIGETYTALLDLRDELYRDELYRDETADTSALEPAGIITAPDRLAEFFAAIKSGGVTVLVGPGDFTDED